MSWTLKRRPSQEECKAPATVLNEADKLFYFVEGNKKLKKYLSSYSAACSSHYFTVLVFE
jgi:hypothetical protein